MTATFDKVADIIAETSEIDRESITPESHTIDDLGIDSLDFLDIVFAIDKEFGIKIPLEKWTQDVTRAKFPPRNTSFSRTSVRRSTNCGPQRLKKPGFVRCCSNIFR